MMKNVPRKSKEKEKPREEFYGEVGVHHRTDAGVEPDNPDGGEYGRRNYHETGYLSGSPDLEPGEYRKPMPGFDLYEGYYDDDDADDSKERGHAARKAAFLH